MQPDILLALDKAKKGDQTCRAYLVENNTPLVWSIVKRFLNRGHEAEDLFQVGAIGLIKAIDKFDSSYNTCFSTYAVPMITGEIKRFIRDDGIIKISRSIKELGIKVRAVREKLLKTSETEPTISQLAQILNVTDEDIVMALDAYTPPDTFDMEKENLLTDKEETFVDKIAIKDALNSLPPKERQIIVMRYFQDKSQTEISKILGISQVQVSRTEKKILAKLKSKLE